MLSNLLIYRFGLFNLAMLVLLGWAWQRGLVQMLLADDGAGIVLLIAGIFALAWTETARLVVRTSRRMNRVKAGAAAPAGPKDGHKAEWLREATDWMVGLGLIGTVIGFKVASGGVDDMGSVEATRDSVEHLMAGIDLALNTTIAGIICGLWHSINVRMLRTAMDCHREDAGR